MQRFFSERPRSISPNDLEDIAGFHSILSMRSLICKLAVLCPALIASAATFTVVNTNDSGAGSLRQAILDSNGTAATNMIAFNIPGTGLQLIKLLSALPEVIRPVTIDGFTQPGASANTLANGNNANWLIELDGMMTGANSLGLRLGATDSSVRGLRIANFQRQGIYISGDNCVVAGCFIYSNRFGGIQLEEAEQSVVGGTARSDRNVISGNSSAGIIFDDGATFNQVSGNFIGTNPSGTGSLGNQGWGIYLTGHTSDARIGGTNAAEGNVIAFNSSGGVQVEFFLASNISIRGNRIFSNGGLGIDLGFPPGVSTNDLGDADFGANQLQNFPLITNAAINAVSTAVQGRLNSLPNTRYVLDLYASAGCDPSGYGEGQFYLGQSSVTTDSNGNANFELIVPTTTEGDSFTVTATDPSGNTSEFSPCRSKPLRLELAVRGERLELILRTVDGSPIADERIPDLRVLSTTNLSLQNGWTTIPNSLELTNGVVRVQGLDLTNDLRFFRSVETD
jgi:hypothetical protein